MSNMNNNNDQDERKDNFSVVLNNNGKDSFTSKRPRHQLKKSKPKPKTNPLQDKWTIWAHDTQDTNWDIESYKKIYEFDTIEDFWVFFNNIKHFRDFMLFIMRGDTLPIYEDPKCKNGGYYSYVVPTPQLPNSIILLLTRMIGETLTDLETFDEVIGMSVSPKGNRSVIKIWNKNKQEHLNFYLKDRYFKGNCRYFPHRK